jgi:Xaa-Pro aminopeptidase
VSEGLLDGVDLTDPEAVTARVRRFYMHRTSHYLGMDVHDVGVYHSGGELRALEENMVITVEPGLYFAPDDESIPETYRGIGIRIEDDVFVSADGPVVLSAHAPKSVAEVEAACAIR